MSSINVTETMLKLYPAAQDCLEAGKHTGTPVTTYFWEPEYDNDRAYLMKTKRCSHCHIPIGGDDYATFEEREAYYEQNRNT